MFLIKIKIELNWSPKFACSPVLVNRKNLNPDNGEIPNLSPVKYPIIIKTNKVVNENMVIIVSLDLALWYKSRYKKRGIQSKTPIWTASDKTQQQRETTKL